MLVIHWMGDQKLLRKARKPLVPAAFAVVNSHQPHWARVVGYGPFSLCVIYIEALWPSSGDINRLMTSRPWAYEKTYALAQLIPLRPAGFQDQRRVPHYSILYFFDHILKQNFCVRMLIFYSYLGSPIDIHFEVFGYVVTVNSRCMLFFVNTYKLYIDNTHTQ
jgi:hypothetical protein